MATGSRSKTVRGVLFSRPAGRLPPSFAGTDDVLRILPAFGRGRDPLSEHTPNDPVARLQRRLDQGAVHRNFKEPHGYLLSVLEQLNVPLSSQALVFSKTSFQQHLIGPTTPRAVYFNDSVYVGWAQGADFLELAAVDH